MRSTAMPEDESLSALNAYRVISFGKAANDHKSKSDVYYSISIPPTTVALGMVQFYYYSTLLLIFLFLFFLCIFG
jgi:hypothetical protein